MTTNCNHAAVCEKCGLCNTCLEDDFLAHQKTVSYLARICAESSEREHSLQEALTRGGNESTVAQSEYRLALARITILRAKLEKIVGPTEDLDRDKFIQKIVDILDQDTQYRSRPPEDVLAEATFFQLQRRS